MNRETPGAYAQRRANQSRKSYIVSDMGHAMVKCAQNLRAFTLLGLTVVYTARPQRPRNLRTRGA